MKFQYKLPFETTLPVTGVDTFSLSRSSSYKELYFPRKILKPEVDVNTYYYYSLLLLSMMTLITGFTCPPTIYFKFITKCDKCYYKVRQVLLQSATAFSITKCDGLLLQSATAFLLQSATSVITKCDRYYKV